MGTNTACAQYSTTITSTAPANITQWVNGLDGSDISAPPAPVVTFIRTSPL